MNEQELREKIIEALEKGGRNFLKSKETKVSIYEYYADALIAAGMGDVKEAEHRAARAERALYLLSKSVHEFYMKTKFVGDYFVNDPKMICTKFLKQAEKELAEERKND